MAGEDYAIPILQVREILAGTLLTRIHNTPPYMPGVLNLRGTIVPVLDLRRRFNLGPAPDGGRPITVIVEAQDRIVGMQVDSVSDVLGLEPGQIKPPPEWGAQNQLGREFVSGLASIRGEDPGEMLLILRMNSPRGIHTWAAWSPF